MIIRLLRKIFQYVDQHSDNINYILEYNYSLKLNFPEPVLESDLIILVVISRDGIPVLEFRFLDFRSWRSDVSHPFDPM